jgi:hypothetical protein
MRQRQDALECQVQVVGVLSRQIPTRLVEISQSGCLLESGQRIEEGTLGALRLDVHGETYSEDVRATRCVTIAGMGSSYLIGVEFLGTARTDGTSIRRAMSSALRDFVAGSTGYWAR